MREGDASDSLHIIVRGRVRVSQARPHAVQPLVLAELGPGEVVGEMGVLDNQPRSATVTALEETDTLEVRLGGPTLDLTLLRFPDTAAVLLHIMNRRLRSTAGAARTAALEELSRLRSGFISIASHELRTPLTTILGFSELLLAEAPPEDPRHRFLAIIRDDARQLAALVENLLDVSRIENGRLALEPVPLDLAAALPPLLEALGAAAPAHALRAEVDPAARWVLADPPKLQQILANLVGNAIKYSPRGGRVLVAARPDQPPGRVALAVSDEGVGIPPEHLGRIFERFQRVDSAATRGIRGTGLGLYIVKHLVELHGGAVRVESAVGRGSTFRFTLPAAAAPAPAGAAPPPASTLIGPAPSSVGSAT
jgi:signal transduction histidine kinase